MNVISTLLLEGFADSSFARLFTEMNGWTIAIFALGIIFCAIEMILPDFGFFGISGIVLFVTGIVLRMIFDGDALMLLYMVLIGLVLFVFMFWIMSRLITKGRLSKTALFSVKSAVPTGTTEGTRDYTYLVGKQGVAATLLHPVGRANFEGETVDVVARDSYIPLGATVVVTKVEGQRVVVVEQ